MKDKSHRISIPLIVLLCTWRIGQAAPGETESLDTPSPTTPAMQAALAQSSAQHSDKPIEALLATVPKSEQATLALNLFLAITDDAEARRRVGTFILMAWRSSDGLGRRHMLLLTRAYLQTVEHPLEWPSRGLDSGRVFDDSGFQSAVRGFLSGYLGVHPYAKDMRPESTPLDKLKQVYAEAEKTHPDQTVTARIQACKDLLPP